MHRIKVVLQVLDIWNHSLVYETLNELVCVILEPLVEILLERVGISTVDEVNHSLLQLKQERVHLVGVLDYLVELFLCLGKNLVVRK